MYNPQLWRELSQVGQQGLSGAPSGFGNGGFSDASGHGGSAGGPSKLVGALTDLAVVGSALGTAASFNSPFAFLTVGGSETASITIPLPFLGNLNLFCIFNCSHSNEEQSVRQPHETSDTYERFGIVVISQKSAANSSNNILLTQAEIIGDPIVGDSPDAPLSEPPAIDEDQSMSPDDEEDDKPKDKEHSKNKRPSTEEKHQEGQRRKQMDRPGGEKGDRRRPYRQRSLLWWLDPSNNQV